ncbi:NrfD/PsrC family molybdoenzyme membrane anchor subunit [Methylobacterium mesophilicum]|uniref:NrfD/PsrC family molybdoenzyme membrane anchor subunit n=1 Tax=Methylobacterium mesophilicum TaxID=39956 RepID=UPI001FCE9D02|nr:NrfD/PsrC family molybdoenzyme membrane anchor subunit [Methylobacterium mesophilicum]
MSGALLGGTPPGPLIRPEETLQGIGGAVTAIPLTHPGNRRWWIAFAGAASLLGLFALTLAYLLYAGPGIWANNNAVVWALDIASYDWWIGVASGSLLVSAVLLLLGAEWRGAVNRVAETLALLATAAAGLYPIIHLGRPWFFFWNLPYPNTYDLWPQFRSPLLWDAIDIVSFLVICVSLWFIGLLPDLATLRDRAFAEAMRQADIKAPTRKLALLRAQVYGILASGWRGSAAHWQIWVPGLPDCGAARRAAGGLGPDRRLGDAGGLADARLAQHAAAGELPGERGLFRCRRHGGDRDADPPRLRPRRPGDRPPSRCARTPAALPRLRQCLLLRGRVLRHVPQRRRRGARRPASAHDR